jgi:hypothetical protein
VHSVLLLLLLWHLPQGWYSVTPEVVASHQADMAACDVMVCTQCQGDMCAYDVLVEYTQCCCCAACRVISPRPHPQGW